MDNYEQSDLTPSQRRNLILDMMKKKKSVSVHQLSKELYLHEATVRRDLNYLADSGAISRVHGGAVLREGMDAEIPLFIRETSFKEIKKELARTAAETVKDGESIFLDSSSTTGFMIPFLTDRKQLKIVTNGAQAVLYLTKLRDARIFCTGAVYVRTACLISATPHWRPFPTITLTAPFSPAAGSVWKMDCPIPVKRKPC